MNLKKQRHKTKLINILLFFVFFGISGSAIAQSTDKEITIKRGVEVIQERKGRFLKERKEDELILAKNSVLSKSLSSFLSKYNYVLLWDVPLDCATGYGRRYKGKILEEILFKIANEYKLHVKIYKNRKIKIKRLFDDYLLFCGNEHYKINYRSN